MNPNYSSIHTYYTHTSKHSLYIIDEAGKNKITNELHRDLLPSKLQNLFPCYSAVIFYNEDDISRIRHEFDLAKQRFFNAPKALINMLRCNPQGLPLTKTTLLCGVRGNNKALSKASAGNQEKSLTQP
ncbi:hypothetical protein YC2023_122096 [Brassica napus]